MSGPPTNCTVVGGRGATECTGSCETNRLQSKTLKKYGLENVPTSYIADWEYGDYHFNKTRGEIPSVIKLWQSGFHEVTDTIELFLRVLDQYRAARLLP